MNFLKNLILVCILGLTLLGTTGVFADQIFTPTGSRVDLDLQNGKNT